MVTSFFGPCSFGGDAIYVERLSRSLLRRGHEVHVAHSSGAFEVVRGSQPRRRYEAPEGLVVHDVGRGLPGRIAAFWNHQTGGAALDSQALGPILKGCDFDIIHIHNASLLGGRTLPLVLVSRPDAVKLVTAHDYWWLCPQSLLWKYGRKVCDAPACVTCSMCSGRPPQLWRRPEWFNRVLAHVDGILFPSRSAREACRARGFAHPRQYLLPGLLPADWAAGTVPGVPSAESSRPYFAAAGRLVTEKGFHEIVPLMREQPDVDLRIAGSGPAERLLRRLARGLPNVRFEGLLDHDRIRSLFRGARAVIVPSLFPETFGMVAAEAMSLGTPVLARNRGSLPELLEATSGGFTFDHARELFNHMRRLVSDGGLHRRLSDNAAGRIPHVWYEEAHTDAYLEIVQETAAGRSNHSKLDFVGGP